MSVQDRIRIALKNDSILDEDISDWGGGFYAAWDGTITRVCKDADGVTSEEPFDTVDALKILKANALNTTQRALLIGQMRTVLQADTRFSSIDSNVAADGMAALALLVQWRALHARIDGNGDVYVWQLGETQADEVKVT